jgi:uncharacterized membrane protein YraQ (UPF0718 family)
VSESTRTTIESLPPANRGAEWNWGTAAILSLVVASLLLPLLFAGNPTIRTLSISFVSIVLEAFPFLLLGSLAGGLVEVYLSAERLTALLPKRRLPALLAAGLLGLVLPLCECAVIPVTRRLIRKGLPFSVALTYLIAGPIVNPIVAASTAAAYLWNWEVVGLRLGSGFLIAVLVSLVVDFVFPRRKALRPAFARQLDDNNGDSCGCCSPEDDHSPNGAEAAGRLKQAFSFAAEDFLYVSQFLIAGAFLAALSQTLLERQALLELGDTAPLAIMLMMGLAVALNLCSEADAFVAAAFRGALPFVSQLAFMVLGPMLDLKLAAMYLSFVRKRAFIVIATLMVLLVLGTMLLLNLYLPEVAP